MTDINVVYDVFHGESWTILIAIYLYLTGLSAGSFVITALATVMGLKIFKPIGKIGISIAIFLLMLAPVFLIIELEQPVRFFTTLMIVNYTSPMSYGVFLLSIYPINCIIYAFFMFRGDQKMTKIFGLIGIPLAVSVHGYTGFILAVIRARPLWNTALMPPLFLISAILSGIAMMILVTVIKDRFFSPEKKVSKPLIFALGQMMMATILVDLFMIFGDLIVLMRSHDEAYETLLLILTGEFSFYFLGVELLFGSFLPLAILFSPLKRSVPATAFAAICVMIGIFTMRFVVIVGGLHLPVG